MDPIDEKLIQNLSSFFVVRIRRRCRHRRRYRHRRRPRRCSHQSRYRCVTYSSITLPMRRLDSLLTPSLDPVSLLPFLLACIPLDVLKVRQIQARWKPLFRYFWMSF